MYEKAKVHKKPLLPSLCLRLRPQTKPAKQLTHSPLCILGHIPISMPHWPRRTQESRGCDPESEPSTTELITRHDFDHTMLAPRSDLPRGPTGLPPSF